MYTLTFDIWFGAKPIAFPNVFVIISLSSIPPFTVVYAGLNVFTATKLEFVSSIPSEFVSLSAFTFATVLSAVAATADFIPYVVTSCDVAVKPLPLLFYSIF